MLLIVGCNTMQWHFEKSKYLGILLPYLQTHVFNNIIKFAVWVYNTKELHSYIIYPIDKLSKLS
jgi:hypothetical protein